MPCLTRTCTDVSGGNNHTPPVCSTAQTVQLGRIKKIIKQDGDVKAVSTDANYTIAKAAVRITSAAERLHETNGDMSPYCYLSVCRRCSSTCSWRPLRSMHLQGKRLSC